MLESAWLFVGVMAALVTGGAALTPDDGWAVIFGMAGFLSWAVFAYGGLDVIVATSGVTIQFTMPVLTMFGVIMSFIPLFIALTGPANLLASRYQNPRTDEL